MEREVAHWDEFGFAMVWRSGCEGWFGGRRETRVTVEMVRWARSVERMWEPWMVLYVNYDGKALG